MSGSSVTGKPQYHGQDITKLTTELREYHAVAYETDMLSDVLKVAQSFPRIGTTADALTESFVMHFRTLASFLWDERTKRTWPTDALAGDFVKAGQWLPKEAKPQQLIDRVSREVAHLTTFRLSGPHSEKDWTPRECVAALLPTLEQFASMIDPAKESPRLKPAVTRLREFFDSQDPAIRVWFDTSRSTTAETTIKAAVSARKLRGVPVHDSADRNRRNR
jgi:hypothetical protein